MPKGDVLSVWELQLRREVSNFLLPLENYPFRIGVSYYYATGEIYGLRVAEFPVGGLTPRKEVLEISLAFRGKFMDGREYVSISPYSNELPSYLLCDIKTDDIFHKYVRQALPTLFSYYSLSYQYGGKKGREYPKELFGVKSVFGEGVVYPTLSTFVNLIHFKSLQIYPEVAGNG
jgi:hypothetical protein